MPLFGFREGRESGPESEVRARESQQDGEGHGLAVVEFGVRGPERVVDVGCVPVGEEGAEGVGGVG